MLLALLALRFPGPGVGRLWTMYYLSPELAPGALPLLSPAGQTGYRTDPAHSRVVAAGHPTGTQFLLAPELARRATASERQSGDLVPLATATPAPAPA